MYAAAHTSLALVAKRQVPAASLFGLMVTAQATELLWIALTCAGVERPSVDARGSLHLEYLPYSHSLLVGLGGGVVLWAVLRHLWHRADLASVFGWVFASHIVLDVIQHEPNIRLVPWSAHPTVGMNLQASPWLDLALETALCIACWAYHRGSRRLLIGLVVLNLANVPLMLGGQGNATALAGDRFALPAVIAGTVALAWAVIHRYANKPEPADTGAAPATAAVSATPA